MKPRNLNEWYPFLFVAAYILIGALIPITLRTGLLFPATRAGGQVSGGGVRLITRPECGLTNAPAIIYPQYKF